MLPLFLVVGMTISENDLKKEVNDLVEQSFPELQSETIELRFFEGEKDYFFSTMVENLFSPPRLYVIYIHQKILHEAPPKEALRAILAHELQHLSDYLGKSVWELGKLAARYYGPFSLGFIAQFERRTDEQIIRKGFGEGLKIYRHWLYQQLPPEIISKKKKLYFTPEEIASYDQL